MAGAMIAGLLFALDSVPSGDRLVEMSSAASGMQYFSMASPDSF